MDKQILVWRAKSREKINEAIFELIGNNKQGYSDMAYNHRTDQLLVASLDGELGIW